jgi:hypothetical protein
MFSKDNVLYVPVVLGEKEIAVGLNMDTGELSFFAGEEAAELSREEVDVALPVNQTPAPAGQNLQDLAGKLADIVGKISDQAKDRIMPQTEVRKEIAGKLQELGLNVDIDKIAAEKYDGDLEKMNKRIDKVSSFIDKFKGQIEKAVAPMDVSVSEVDKALGEMKKDLIENPKKSSEATEGQKKIIETLAKVIAPVGVKLVIDETTKTLWDEAYKLIKEYGDNYSGLAKKLQDRKDAKLAAMVLRVLVAVRYIIYKDDITFEKAVEDLTLEKIQIIEDEMILPGPKPWPGYDFSRAENLINAMTDYEFLGQIRDELGNGRKDEIDKGRLITGYFDDILDKLISLVDARMDQLVWKEAYKLIKEYGNNLKGLAAKLQDRKDAKLAAMVMRALVATWFIMQRDKISFDKAANQLTKEEVEELAPVGKIKLLPWPGYDFSRVRKLINAFTDYKFLGKVKDELAPKGGYISDRLVKLIDKRMDKLLEMTPGHNYVPGQALVRLKEGVSISDVENDLKDMGIKVEKDLGLSYATVLLVIFDEGKDAEAMFEAISGLEDVEAAEPNYLRRIPEPIVVEDIAYDIVPDGYEVVPEKMLPYVQDILGPDVFMQSWIELGDTRTTKYFDKNGNFLGSRITVSDLLGQQPRDIWKDANGNEIDLEEIEPKERAAIDGSKEELVAQIEQAAGAEDNPEAKIEAVQNVLPESPEYTPLRAVLDKLSIATDKLKDKDAKGVAGILYEMVNDIILKLDSMEKAGVEGAKEIKEFIEESNIEMEPEEVKEYLKDIPEHSKVVVAGAKVTSPETIDKYEVYNWSDVRDEAGNESFDTAVVFGPGADLYMVNMAVKEDGKVKIVGVPEQIIESVKDAGLALEVDSVKAPKRYRLTEIAKDLGIENPETKEDLLGEVKEKLKEKAGSLAADIEKLDTDDKAIEFWNEKIAAKPEMSRVSNNVEVTAVKTQSASEIAMNKVLDALDKNENRGQEIGSLMVSAGIIKIMSDKEEKTEDIDIKNFFDNVVKEMKTDEGRDALKSMFAVNDSEIDAAAEKIENIARDLNIAGMKQIERAIESGYMEAREKKLLDRVKMNVLLNNISNIIGQMLRGVADTPFAPINTVSASAFLPAKGNPFRGALSSLLDDLFGGKSSMGTEKLTTNLDSLLMMLGAT